ncbi:MAG: hypothetical protein WEE64_04235 [Dehalococcoidia bacterium]
MGFGIGLGLVVVAFMFAFLGIIIFKEARTHRFWRRRVEEGDMEMIRQLVEMEVDAWRIERPPKGMPATVWQGIQAVELIEIGRDYIRASSTAEPQFALVATARRQVSSALDEAKRVTAKLVERFFYDIPHVRAERVQIDVYTTFHEPNGDAVQRCILTTVAQRDAAAGIDWDDDPPESIAERLGARYELDILGHAQPIEPDEEAVRISVNGTHAEGTQ